MALEAKNFEKLVGNPIVFAAIIALFTALLSKLFDVFIFHCKQKSSIKHDIRRETEQKETAKEIESRTSLKQFGIEQITNAQRAFQLAKRYCAEAALFGLLHGDEKEVRDLKETLTGLYSFELELSDKDFCQVLDASIGVVDRFLLEQRKLTTSGVDILRINMFTPNTKEYLRAYARLCYLSKSLLPMIDRELLILGEKAKNLLGG